MNLFTVIGMCACVHVCVCVCVCVCVVGGWGVEGEVAIIREGAVLSPALGFEVLEVQPEAWLGTCPSILSTRMPGPSFSGFPSSYLLSIAFLYSVSMAMS